MNFILKKAGIENCPKFLIRKHLLMIEIKSFFLFIEEIEKKIQNKEFISNFVYYFSQLKLSEYEESKSIKNINKALKNLKKNRFVMSFMDFTHFLIKTLQISYVEDKFKIKEQKKYISLLAPPVSFGVEKLILQRDFFLKDDSSNVFKEEVLLNKSKDLDKTIEKINKNHKKIILSLGSMSKEKRNFFISLKKIIWLRDYVDFYHDKTEINYTKYFLKYFKKKNVRVLGESTINEIMKFSLKRIKEMILKKRLLCTPKRKIDKQSKEEFVSSFPLSGMVASSGSFSGVVKIVKNNNDMDSLTSKSVLVAQYTKPSLVVGMAISRGIITETGGIASHASIVSRELGKPCVVGVNGCTSLLKDGDIVNVRDGKIFKVN
jgi:phosphohistidine swiveling domain-containing protein